MTTSNSREPQDNCYRVPMKQLQLAIGLLACSVLVAAECLPEEANAAVQEQGSRVTHTASAIEIPTAEGVALEGFVHRPATANGVAVVLAPGQGYHMGLPLITHASGELANAGFTAVRFDWAYFTAKGQRSGDLLGEEANLEAALAFARGLDGVEKVILVGKSLGSMVAQQRARKRSDDLHGLGLLTFPIHNPGSPDTRFGTPADFDSIEIPVLFICGNTDPLSELKPLYELVAEMKRTPCVSIVPGDHSLRERERGDQNTQENIELAVDALVLWARRWTAE